MEICEVSHYSTATPLSHADLPPGSQETSGNDVTQLLKRWRKGSREAEAELMERVQGELRRLAAGYMRRERVGKTLQPTAVVNEAYMRLLPQRGVSWESRAHFFGIAAKMMRRVLVDHARRRKAIKRDAGPGEPVSISGVPSPAREADPVDLLALHTALDDLAALAPGGGGYLNEDAATLDQGKAVFAERCARCHSSKGPALPGDLDLENCNGPGTKA